MVCLLSMEDSIKPTLEDRFQAEKLSRAIKECEDIDSLREMAMNLLELVKKKTAIVNWLTKRALEAEINTEGLRNKSD